MPAQYTDHVIEPGGRPADDTDRADPPPRDACGVFGVWSPGEDVAKLTYFGLYALQHRGQESAGIAVSDGTRTHRHTTWLAIRCQASVYQVIWRNVTS